jgi:tetraacyldisaccharide 4'-kinase
MTIANCTDVMLSGVLFREIVSGRKKGLAAGAARGVLSVLETPYRWAIGRRNAHFDRNAAAVTKIAVPVISVGNLTVGGTGKTPFVAWLAEWFTGRAMPVTIISRGYGASGGEQNDEALELAARLPGLPHLQNADRVVAARAAVAERARQVLILDDAFQHRRIGRDLDIVLLDALEPFGYGHLLPRGLLREPIGNLARANVVGLSRSDAVSEERRREIRAVVGKYAPGAAWLELEHRPQRLVSTSGQIVEFSELRGHRLAAFCGIGNPEGFRHTLLACGLGVADLLELPDHCAYGAAEMQKIERRLKSLDVTDVVCTRKDLVKIPRMEIAGKRLLGVDVRLEITEGEESLTAMLSELAARVAAA